MMSSVVVEQYGEVLRAIVQDYVDTREPVGSKAIVERHAFTSPRLVALQEAVRRAGPASAAIGRLGALVSWLESSTHNLLLRPLTLALLVSDQMAVAIDR